MNITIISKKTGAETTLPEEMWEEMKSRGDDRGFRVKKTVIQPPMEAVKAASKAKAKADDSKPDEAYDNDL